MTDIVEVDDGAVHLGVMSVIGVAVLAAITTWILYPDTAMYRAEERAADAVRAFWDTPVRDGTTSPATQAPHPTPIQGCVP